jgi:hypothetical protein
MRDKEKKMKIDLKKKTLFTHTHTFSLSHAHTFSRLIRVPFRFLVSRLIVSRLAYESSHQGALWRPRSQDWSIARACACEKERHTSN